MKPGMSRRQVEFAARRQLIVDSTRRLIAERTIEASSMDLIAGSVQYTRRTLYTYFKSRDEILLQVFSEDLSARWTLQKQSIAEVESGLAKMSAWAETLFDFAQKNPSTLRLQSYWNHRGIDRAKISDEVFVGFEKVNDELADGLREIFRLGIADGTLRSDLSVDLCISQFIYGARTAVDRALSSAYSFANFEAREYFDSFLDLFTRSVRNQEEIS